ncbi:MAG TPA: DUF4129 domain-containing protein [Mucilaginibacter sp.]|jgi:hypothetical protein
MLRYLYLIIIILIASLSLGYASKPVTPVKQKAILKADSTVIEVRHFNNEQLRDYSKQSEFQYHDVEMQPSLWTRFWRWFWHLFDFLKPGVQNSGNFFYYLLEYLFILLGVGAIIFFVLKLAGIDMLNIFRRNPLIANLPYSESLENIHQVDFDAEIEKATAQRNYRLAVRLLYLKCLKKLNDASVIKWQPEKTNNEYINELNNTEQRHTFKLLTRQFEYVWYGEFSIDAPVFRDINSLFQEFNNSIR